MACCGGRPQGEPLHISVEKPRMEVGGINILPVLSGAMGLMSEAARRKKLAKGAAPPVEDVKDFHDTVGRSPYTTAEIMPGKVWKVQYDFEMFFAFSKDGEVFNKMIGANFGDPKDDENVLEAAKRVGKEDQARKDLLAHEKCMELQKTKGHCKETVAAWGPFSQNMIVVRLNSGGLLLYNPCKVRDEYGFAAWLEGLGRVEWIVSGSSAHTLTLPAILKRYPDAKVVMSEDAETKILAGQTPSKKADFVYTKESDLEAASKLLNSEGVYLYSIVGDVATSALILVAHKVAMEVDIIYSNPVGFGVASREEFENSDRFGFDRLFYWAVCCKPNSPNGFLPKYRFWSMDPTGPFRLMSLSSPKLDGSSCTDMANSLRTALRADFHLGVGAHNHEMTADEFRESVDNNWNWLDGRSLIN